MRKKYNCEEHPDYSRWLAMRQRCLNPTSDNYHRYGAKGITIAEDLMSFEDFSTYISTLNNYGVVGVTLDRIDPKKNYEKGNLRWASKSVQNANQLGNSKGNNKYVGVNWSKTHMRWVARVTLEGATIKFILKKLLTTTSISGIMKLYRGARGNLRFWRLCKTNRLRSVRNGR